MKKFLSLIYLQTLKSNNWFATLIYVSKKKTEQLFDCMLKTAYLRNELNFWDVHGIMNTSGLLQNLNLFPIFTFHYKYQKYKKYS